MDRKVPLIALAVLTVLVAADLRRPPGRQWAVRLVLPAIDAWQSLSSHADKHEHCRFTPTCSVYGELAVRRYGAYRGVWLIAGRLLRCNPWTKGGVDWPPGPPAGEAAP